MPFDDTTTRYRSLDGRSVVITGGASGIHSGSLFSMRVDVAGLPEHRFDSSV